MVVDARMQRVRGAMNAPSPWRRQGQDRPPILLGPSWWPEGIERLAASHALKVLSIGPGPASGFSHFGGQYPPSHALNRRVFGPFSRAEVVH